MKKFTPILTLGLMATALTAGAQATFEQATTEFWTTHRTMPYIGDFNGDDNLDVFYAGQGNNLFNTPGWWWQIQQNFCINNGDGTFTIDGYSFQETEGEPQQKVDENGNPVVDENGNPVMETPINYDRVYSNHGVRGSSFNQYASLDYNNDGKLDLLLYGRYEWDIFLSDDEKNSPYLLLYKNLGEGKFELVADAAFPVMTPDNNSVNYSLSVGDYDRDGYVDFIVSATGVSLGDNMPGRTVSLYHNDGGTGVFTDMKIAETKGGVWTNEVKDEATEEVIVEKQQLEGYFLPMSGNVHFADFNNDGWLDILADGWADNNWDGVHSGGNTCKIYINVEGEKFVDVTPEVPSFYTLRSSASSIADFDKDGNLDFFMTGWGDNGYKWNAFLYYNTKTQETLFDAPLDCATLGLDGTEKCRQVLRDYNGDGILDIYYAGASGCYFYDGDITGGFIKGETLGDYSAGGAAAGDINGNGLSDLFMAGYSADGAMAKLMLNTTGEVEAPAAPENVDCVVADGVLTITWEYDTDAAAENALVYNLFVKYADGSVYSLIPANPETGFVKVGEGRQVGLRPNVLSYTLPEPTGDYTVGVQAISTYNETYSAFTTKTVSGVESIAVDNADFTVSVAGDDITVNGEGEVVVYNVVGAKVAAGVAGQPINVAGNGVYIVTVNGQSQKIVK